MSVVVVGLVGFARLMRGDTFEVSLRYGQQKWKSKGRVGEVTQEWQNDSVTLRALVGDVFNIKVGHDTAVTTGNVIKLNVSFLLQRTTISKLHGREMLLYNNKLVSVLLK